MKENWICEVNSFTRCGLCHDKFNSDDHEGMRKHFKECHSGKAIEKTGGK